MLRNMKAEMIRNHITTEMVMKVIGRSDKTTRSKINGKSPLHLNEAIKIRDTLFPGMDIEYLFDKGDDRTA